MLRKTVSGILAGIVICIGGSVFLSVDNKIAGAVLFSVALLSICIKGYSLFTGKVGFIPEKHGKEEFSVLFCGLLGNFIATVLGGLLIRFAISSIGENAEIMCKNKLTQTSLSTFIRALFCGILMYLAVSIFKENNRIVGILFCIPVFILSGFEHSIADMFYFAVAGKFTLSALAFIIIVILGNSVGGMLLPALQLFVKNNPKKEN